jgi:hypothetical protein
LTPAGGSTAFCAAKKSYLSGKNRMESPLVYFSSLSDPRVEMTREHRLEDILFIAIASVICGAA